jgi:hypothetical protein
MANMSSNILRLLVSSKFNINPEEIILSGVIDKEFTPQNNQGHSWWNGAERQEDTIIGFSAQEGFKKLEIKAEYSYYHNGESEYEAGETLSSYLRKTGEEYIFFLVHSVGKEYGETGQAFDKWTLYKSADFKKHWDMLEAKDIIRWEQWLNSDHIVDANEMA